MPEQQPKKYHKTVKRIYNLSTLGIQIAAFIFGGAYAGGWLDEKYNTEKAWFTLGLVLLTTALAMYYAIVRLNKLNSNE